jgi:hypothetical protein
MTGDDLVSFRQRLAAEPALRDIVSEVEELRGWFRRGSVQPHIPASPGFTASVLAAARRLPTREELQAEETNARTYENELVTCARRISSAAAVVLGLALVIFATLNVPRDASRLEAGVNARLRAMEVLDQAIMNEQAGVEPRDR